MSPEADGHHEKRKGSECMQKRSWGSPRMESDPGLLDPCQRASVCGTAQQHRTTCTYQQLLAQEDIWTLNLTETQSAVLRAGWESHIQGFCTVRPVVININR